MDRDIKNGANSKTQTSKIADWLENLKSEDVKKRTISVSHLGDIAQVFGPRKTKDSILPFLCGKYIAPVILFY